MRIDTTAKTLYQHLTPQKNNFLRKITLTFQTKERELNKLIIASWRGQDEK